MIGENVGSYRIIRVLGEGGMGRVYLAEHSLIGKRAAVKVLLPQYSARPEIVNRFFNEARSSSLLKHPGVVDIYDFGRLPNNGSLFIIMEFLEGESLGARLQKTGRLANNLVIDIARQIANALATAHEHGIVHRDLKPDNIYFIRDSETRSGVRAKILDFGIAKLLDSASSSNSATKTGAILGTPTYMSPEQCRGISQIDHRSDIYSLGCVMFEMVSGRPPFTGEGAGDMIGAHIYQPPPSLTGVVPDPLAELIAQMLAKSPAERVQSMTDVVGALDHIGAAGPWRLHGSTMSLPSPAPALNESYSAATLKPRTTLGDAAGEVARAHRTAPSRRGMRLFVISAAATVVFGGGVIAWQLAGPPAATEPVDSIAPPNVAATVPAPAPPPPPVAAPRSVSVRLVSQPEGADVERDGVRVGKTPWTDEYPARNDEVVYILRAKGYRDYSVSVRRDRDVVVEKTLEKIGRKTETHAPVPAPARPKRVDVLDPFAH
jgi:serine/threonine-protein kinase